MEEKLYKIKKGSVMNFYSTEPTITINGIEASELTQKTRDDKNKFTTTFSQNGNTRILSGKISAEASTQYVFSAVSTLNHPLQFAINYFNAENTLISSSPYYNNGSSFTTPANTTSLSIQVRDFENSGTSNTINVAEVIEPQLEIGSVATEYQEPGASPSIEYPSEIENVVDNKNKFNANSDNITFIKDSNIEALTKINNNSIKIESKLNWSREKVKIANLKPKTPYNVSCIISSVTGDLINTTRGIWNGINLVDSDLVTENVNRRLKIDISTDSDGVLTFWFYCNYSSNNLTGTIIFDEIKVTEGKGMTDSGIVLDIVGKNFIGYKENGTVTKYGLTINYNNGIFTINGTANRDSYLNLTDVLSLNIYSEEKGVTPRKLYKNKYNLGYKYISGTKSISNTNLAILDKVESPVNKFYLNGCHLEDKNLIINITDTLDYYMYLWIKSGTVLTDFKFEIQLEVGETVTAPEPYKEVKVEIDLPENVFLGAINNNKDTLKNINGKWILKKCIKKIEFNGTEDWEMDSTGVYHILKSKIPGMNLPYNSIDMICNCFLVTTGTTAIGTFRVGTSYLNFNYDDGIGGLANWKAKLVELNNAGTPLTVYYLSDEEEIEISNFSNLSNMRCIVGENNFSSYPSKSTIFYYDERKEEDAISPIIIKNNGKLSPFNLTIDYNKTNLPLMAEAIEASQTITGADGEIVLDTTYGSRLFEIDAVTDDFLTSEQKEAKREEVRKFLNSIKKVNTKLIIEPLNRTFEVKYAGLAEDTNLPKCVEFLIPLKSASAYAISNETYTQIGEGEIESETEEPVGFVCTITGPANYPRITLNGYLMDYDNVILEGEKLIIDSKKSTVTHINKMGIETNGMVYYNHQFPKIQKGVNILNIVDGIEDNNLKIEWNDLLL